MPNELAELFDAMDAEWGNGPAESPPQGDDRGSQVQPDGPLTIVWGD